MLIELKHLYPQTPGQNCVIAPDIQKQPETMEQKSAISITKTIRQLIPTTMMTQNNFVKIRE